nr:unnamed protein product [Callosobruchus chinensis]
MHYASTDPIDPPNLWASWDKSTKSSVPVLPIDGALKSGVTTFLTSGHGAYVETTNVPGAFT